MTNNQKTPVYVQETRRLGFLDRKCRRIRQYMKTRRHQNSLSQYIGDPLRHLKFNI